MVAPDPLSAVASAVALIQTCKAIAVFIVNFIRTTGTEGIEALQMDIASLSIQLQAVEKRCKEASGPPPFKLEEHILNWILVVLSRCEVMLTKLNGIIDEFRSYDNTKLGRFKSNIRQALRSSDVQDLQDEMAKYRQYLHFYMTLVNGCRIDELLRVINSFLNQNHAPARPIPHSPRPSQSSIYSQSTEPQSQSATTLHSTPRRNSDALDSIPIDLLDYLRPPGVAYGAPLINTTLFHSKCYANAASHSGSFVGWFGGDLFSIYQITGHNPTPICSGRFQRKHYYYGRTEDKRSLTQSNNQRVSKFCCAALSDRYVAVGTQEGMLLIFAVQGAILGERPGQWLCSANLSGSVIEKLLFTPEGDELLLVLSTNDASHPCQKLLVFPTSEFAKAPGVADDKVKDLTQFTTAAEWRDSVCQIPDAAISSDGRKLAIYTSHNNNGFSEIRLLRKSRRDGCWRKAFEEEISVVTIKGESKSPGMTGISFFDNDRDLVFSMQTSAPGAEDWVNLGALRLCPRNKSIASERSKSNTMAIAVSPTHNVVALASNCEGRPLLEFKQQCFDPLPLILHSVTIECACQLVKPLNLSFAEGGSRVILLTGKGDLEIHKLETSN